MTNNNPNQPKKFDAVLGGKNPPPIDGVVLGGIEGVKNRLKSSDIELKIAALTEAINYEDAGVDLVIEALYSDVERLQLIAARLLRKRGGVKGNQALLDHNHKLFFTTLENWKTEIFNPEIGISDTIGTAYRLNINWRKLINSQETTRKEFDLFLQDPRSSQVEALLLPIGRTGDCNDLVKVLVEGKNWLTNLKALYIGDMYDYEYKTSDVTLSNMSPVLEAYPHLEALQVRGIGESDYGYEDNEGGFGYEGLSFYKTRHENLKTLIIETGYKLSRKLINQICALELPSLEYLELWLGHDTDTYYPVWALEEERYSIDNSAFKHLSPIISGAVFPQLKYLGLRSSNYSDAIAQAIVNFPLINNLKVLDLSMGTLTVKGAKLIQNCVKVNQLNCRVITELHTNSKDDRYHALTE